jgi:Holliday junction resolvase
MLELRNKLIESELIEKKREWEKRMKVQKGDIGEILINRFLQAKGYATYSPTQADAHIIDLIAYKNGKMMAFDIKTKARRNNYADTGIDFSHFKKYQELNNKIPVFLFFVDEELKEVYGNTLSNLIKSEVVMNKTYPSIEEYNNGKCQIIYFPLKSMKRNIINLTDAECNAIKNLHKRNYNYELKDL